MSTKKLSLNTVLIGLIALLILSFIIGLVVKSTRGIVALPNDILGKAQLEKIDTMKFEIEGKQIVLSKQGEKWEINGEAVLLDADQALVNSTLDTIKNLELKRLASNDEASNKKLGITDASKIIKVELLGEKKSLVSFSLTKDGSAQGEYYFQKQGQLETYSIQGSLGLTLNRKAEDWVDKSILPGIKEEEIQKFSIKSGKDLAQFDLASDKKTWSGQGASDAKKATTTEISPLLHHIMALRANSVETISEADFAAKLKNLDEKFEVSINSKPVFKLLAGKEKNAPYLVSFSEPRKNREGKYILYTIDAQFVGDMKVSIPLK